MESKLSWNRFRRTKPLDSSPKSYPRDQQSRAERCSDPTRRRADQFIFRSYGLCMQNMQKVALLFRADSESIRLVLLVQQSGNSK